MEKKTFFTGLALLVAFLAVLVVLFLPIFGGGQNALNYLDNLYNSISKGSAYYIEGLQAQNKDYTGREIDVSITLDSQPLVENTAALFEKAGAATQIDGAQIGIKGDLGKILAASLQDADWMFHNNADAVSSRYGFDARQALYNWWIALKGLEKELTRQKRFEEAKFVAAVDARAVECAYNYFGIQPQSIGDKMWIVILSLAFYVFYTLWFGFSIMYLFEGWGMDLEH
jgi:hypothetical protein